MKEKIKLGRKPIPELERKVAVVIYVKTKFAAMAKKECLAIQDKYQSEKLK